MAQSILGQKPDGSFKFVQLDKDGRIITSPLTVMTVKFDLNSDNFGATENDADASNLKEIADAWESDSTSPFTPPQANVTYDFGDGESERVIAYSLTAGSNDKCPKVFKLQGSADDSDWRTLDEREETGWTPGAGTETRLFRVTTPGTYRYYRFVIEEAQEEGEEVQLSQICFYEEETFS